MYNEKDIKNYQKSIIRKRFLFLKLVKILSIYLTKEDI
jgi:hypothetical protein